ncbi:MAG: fibronectin type III domain-containing protein [Paramuribaculum sp.]|nr:fibronectin type III domain-containing protein [Paramuribaculum sp.]
MSKFRKLMAIATLLFASSSVFVACSDDDPSTMGPVPVNSVRVTSTSVTVIWSIVPNEKCDGYEVSILQGSRDGAVVGTQTFDNRTAEATFTGLTPNTRYVAKTQAKPGKGFSGSEPYYREFTTSPNIDVVVTGFEPYQVDGFDKDGNPTVTDYVKVSLSWTEIPNTNCGGYGIYLYECAQADWKSSLSAVGSALVSKSNVTSASIEKLKPSTTYTIRAYATPSTMCDYAVGDNCLSEFTTPAAPAAQ